MKAGGGGGSGVHDGIDLSGATITTDRAHSYPSLAAELPASRQPTRDDLISPRGAEEESP